MNGTVIFVASDRLGEGDPELGAALMLAALKNLPKTGDEPPTHLLFMNAGAKLCCEGSAALADLRALADAGAELLVCGTCLDWFDLKERLAVGRESNMVEILRTQREAARVLRL